MDSLEKYKVVGLMSGTSLDGIDIVSCIIKRRNGRWVFGIEAAQTVSYSPTWLKKLSQAPHLSGQDLLALHAEYGKYLGILVQAFIIKHKLTAIHFIASHGHTIFHQPERGFTFQLGNGNSIHAAAGLPVVYDFRSLDVALGGQGAPLVPIADKFLFHEYDICLNLGGIANLSLDEMGKRMAFDICYVNMGLNHLALQAGRNFDKDGELSSTGSVNEGMLRELRKIYNKIRKKRPSLSREFFEQSIRPLLDLSTISIADRLRTLTESIALEIAQALPDSTNKKMTMLCTGGGAFNSFLMYRLIECCDNNITILVPDDDIVKFKEAVAFAFLGVLRVRNEINSLKSVTKAKSSSCGGEMVGFKTK